MILEDLLGKISNVDTKGVRIIEWRTINRRYPVSSRTQSPNGNVHTQLIEKVGDVSSPLLTSPIRVRCSCKDFKYRWDYALWRANLSRGAISQHIPSDQTNPNYHVSLCKHLSYVCRAAYQVARQGQL